MKGAAPITTKSYAAEATAIITRINTVTIILNYLVTGESIVQTKYLPQNTIFSVQIQVIFCLYGFMTAKKMYFREMGLAHS